MTGDSVLGRLRVGPQQRTLLLRYATVGISSNGILLGIYAGLIHVEVHYRIAATCTFFLGLAITFVFNRNWTFANTNPLKGSIARYAGAYATAYVLNIALLAALVDGLGANRVVGQGVCIVVVGVTLFLLQRYFVFVDR